MASHPQTAESSVPWPLTAPESLVLLGGGSAPTDAEVIRAGLVDTVVRGCLAVDRRSLRGIFRSRRRWLLAPGPRPERLVAVLAPFVAALDVAEPVVDLDGRPAWPIATVVAAVIRDRRGTTYTDRDVLPALEAAGLIAEPRRARWYRTSRFVLTPEGEQARQAARHRVDAARRAVAAVRTAADPEATRQARLAAVAALGAAGTLVATEAGLLSAASEVRRAVIRDSGGGAGTVTGGGGSGGSDEPGGVGDPAGDGTGWTPDWMSDLGEAHLGDTFGAVDAGAFDAAGGGADGSGDGGGGGD